MQRSLLQQISRKYSRGWLTLRLRKANFVKLMWMLSPLAIAAGGTMTYIKYDKELRDKIEKNLTNLQNFYKKTKASYSLNALSGYFSFGFDGNQVARVKEKINIGEDIHVGVLPLPEEPISQFKPKNASPQTKEFPIKILDMEKAADLATNLAIKELNKAMETLRSFNAAASEVVDQAVEHADPSVWYLLQYKINARNLALKNAEQNEKEAHTKLKACELALEQQQADEKQTHQMHRLRNKLRKLNERLSKSKNDLNQLKNLIDTNENYWRSVKKARNYFIEEIEKIFPGINLEKKRLNLSPLQLDLFIMHAYTHALVYQQQLQQLQHKGDLLLKQACQAFRDNNVTQAIDLQVEFLLEAEKHKIEIENQKRIAQMRIETERMLMAQLKAQMATLKKLIEEKFATKADALKHNLISEFDEKLAQQSSNYHQELATLVAKMLGQQAALTSCTAVSERAHQKCKFAAACRALWSSVHCGLAQNTLQPLKPELSAVSEIVAPHDELAAVIIESLPATASDRGVLSEAALRARFFKVERIARRVALVPAVGGGLPLHFLSLLQSIFIKQPDLVVVPVDELLAKQVDPNKLDTFEILFSAKYFVERGDFFNAMRYVRLLKGAPRMIAQDWLRETRLLLETRQAVDTLLAHAAVNGLLHL